MNEAKNKKLPKLATKKVSKKASPVSDEQWLDELMKSRKPKTKPIEIVQKKPSNPILKKGKPNSESESWLDVSSKNISNTIERKRTEEGYLIYGMSELVSTAGGGISLLLISIVIDTAECPFNCSCCY